MDETFFQYPGQILREDRLGVFTQSPFLPVHFHWTTTERYRKCGKPTCRCAKADAVGHGPSWSLTRAVKGKTRTKIIPSQAVESTRQQLQRAKTFRSLCQQLLEVNEKICDAKLADPGGDGTPAAKKKGSKTHSPRRSAQRLRR